MKKSGLILTVVWVATFWSNIVLAGDSLPKVLFDQGHRQRFLIGEKGDLQLSGLADIIRGKGSDVVACTGPLNDNSLQGISALVISGPFDSLRDDEVDAVARFLERGGRLAIMLHIGPPVAGLLARLDVDHSNAVLRERNNIIDNALNFRIKGLDSHPLFAGLKQFSLYGGWALKAGKEGVAIARTSSEAWVDLDGDKALSNGDAVGAFDVVIAGSYRSGEFVVFGDDAIFQNKFLDQDNTRLAANLGEWLIRR